MRGNPLDRMPTSVFAKRILLDRRSFLCGTHTLVVGEIAPLIDSVRSVKA